MPRDEPLSWPSIEAVTAATEGALNREIIDVTRIEEGLNATYRVDCADGSRAVLKAATLATDAELLPEPYLLSRLGCETAVPVPEVLSIIPPDEGPLGVASFLTEYCEGRRVTDVSTLSPAVHEGLVREAGQHLAAIHGLRVTDSFGRLRVADDSLVVTPQHESWGPWFTELAAEAADGLLGAGYVTDAEARFADLEPTIRRELAGVSTAINERQVTPAVLHGDHRPANLVLRDDASSITRAVLDFGNCVTGDGLVDVALAEDVLVDIPLGEGTDRAGRLRDALRTAYANGRDTNRDALFDGRYPYYRLYARTRRLASFGYMAQFARRDNPDSVARWWRSFVHERLTEIEGA